MGKNVWKMLAAAAACAMLMAGCGDKNRSEDAVAAAVKEEEAGGNSGENPQEEPSEPKKLTLWYTQPDLEEYFLEAAAAYEGETKVEVEAVQVPALDYIEAINKGSVEDADYPDLYVVTTDQLEKAVLAGLTTEAGKDVCSSDYFSQKALDAVTYKGKRVAYPFYSDTSVLIYNKNYVQEAPATIEDIQSFSEAFEGDGMIQNIFVWNVNDIFVDFFTIGNFVNFGDAYGDSLEHIVLNSEEIQECLSFYQELSQFFAIDRELVSEEQIIQEFAEGKTVYAIIRDDSIEELDALISEENPLPYGISAVPDLTGELPVRPLSITHSIAVNGYSECPKEAADFARFLTVEKAEELYGICGNFPVRKGVSYDNPDISRVLAQYEEALEVPKVMQMSNYWLIMESAFSDIWAGADVAACMEQAQEMMDAALGQ